MILFSLNSSTRLLSGKQSMSIMSKIKLAKKNFCELYHFTTSETSCYADFIIAFYRKIFYVVTIKLIKICKRFIFSFLCASEQRSSTIFIERRLRNFFSNFFQHFDSFGLFGIEYFRFFHIRSVDSSFLNYTILIIRQRL